MKIAVLAVQGAFAEHRKKIEDLGIECMELRKKEDLMKPFDGLILPGGESTVQGKLLKRAGHISDIEAENRRRTAGAGNLCRPDPSGGKFDK